MAMEIRAIDYVDKVVVTDDERRWPICNLFDRAGLLTTEPRHAVLCVAGAPGGWLTFKLAVFDRRHLQ